MLPLRKTIKGSITPGKLADLVVLGEDPRRVDPDEIKDIPVDMTIVGGEIKYRREVGEGTRVKEQEAAR